jgi:uncharacterized protein involved in exopolysaccharide biosynthesis/Mrp family chromosome partitioning ATPase
MINPNSNDNQLQQVVNMLSRRRALILATGMAGAILAGLVGLLLPQKYTAKAQIIIDPQQISAASEIAGRMVPVNELTIETQVAMLASPNYLRHVHASLLTEPELREVALSGTPAAAFGAALAGEANGSNKVDGALPTIEELERSVVAYQERQSRVVAVTFTSTSPKQAAVVANQLARLHVATLLDFKKAEKGSASFEQELTQLEHQLSLASSELVSRESRLAAMRELRNRPGDKDKLIAALNSSFLADLRQTEIALLASKGQGAAAVAGAATVAPGTGGGLQEVRQIIDKRIEKEVDRLLGELENERHIARAHVLSLQQRVEMIEGARTQVRKLEGRRTPPSHQASPNGDPFASLLHRQQREMREQPQISPGVQILTVAEAPLLPSSPRPILFVVPAFVAFAIGGGLLATVLEGLDRRLRSARDVREVLGIDCLGLIPVLRNARSFENVHRFLTQRPLAPYTESVRSVVTAALRLSEPPPHPKVILITSCVAGEGAPMLVTSFASFATLLERRVVVVDLAFGAPVIEIKGAGSEQDAPCIDVLQGRPWKEAIRRLPEVTVDYLPLRTISADPAALVSSARMAELMLELRDNYDCIVVHCDPILRSTASRLLVPLVDSVLLALKWGHSRREVAQNALLMLGGSIERSRQQSPLALSAVITGVNLKKHARFRHGDVAEVLARSATQ